MLRYWNHAKPCCLHSLPDNLLALSCIKNHNQKWPTDGCIHAAVVLWSATSYVWVDNISFKPFLELHIYIARKQIRLLFTNNTRFVPKWASIHTSIAIHLWFWNAMLCNEMSFMCQNKAMQDYSNWQIAIKTDWMWSSSILLICNHKYYGPKGYR